MVIVQDVFVVLPLCELLVVHASCLDVGVLLFPVKYEAECSTYSLILLHSTSELPNVLSCVAK